MLHPREDYKRIQDPAGLIPEYEPVFLLRAQDKVAARTVRAWANYNADAGGDPALSKVAREYADKMDAWPVKKLADLPKEPKAESEIDTVDQPAGLSAEQPAGLSAEQPAGLSAEQPAGLSAEQPKSKPGSGVISEPAESQGPSGSGVVSPPEKSQNKDGSGVVK